MNLSDYYSGYSIYEYIDDLFDRFFDVPQYQITHFKEFTRGLLGCRKKSLQSIKRTLNLENHISTISRNIKKVPEYLKSTKKEVLSQIETLFDKRSNYYVAIDDTMIQRYGKNVYGAAYQHDHSIGASIFANVFVDTIVTNKKGGLFKQFCILPS